jgi:hypothetical protein
VLGVVLPLRSEIAPQERLLALEHLPDVALARRHLEPHGEVGRGDGGLQDEEREDVPRGVVQEDRGAVERHHAAHRPRDGLEEGLAGQVRDQRIVDVQQRPVAIGFRGAAPGHGTYSTLAPPHCTNGTGCPRGGHGGGGRR